MEIKKIIFGCFDTCIKKLENRSQKCTLVIFSTEGGILSLQSLNVVARCCSDTVNSLFYC